jgi:hypothetical protein
VAIIQASDILYLLAAPTSVAGFSVAGVAGNSWGNFCSTTSLSSTAYDNLFSDITGPENVAGQVDYACVFIMNNTTSGNAMLNAIAWLPIAELSAGGGASLAIAVDPTAASVAVGTTESQALGISSATIEPSGVTTWAAPSSSNAGGVALGTIPPGYVKAVWIQRTATDSSPINNQTFGLQVDFSSNG